MKTKSLRIILAAFCAFIAFALLAISVGAQNFDTLSFGNAVKFAGAFQTGTVILTSDCTPDPMNPLGPDDRCVVLSASPARTDFDVTDDIGRTILPKNTAKTLIYQITNVNWFYEFNNTTGAPTTPSQRALFTVTPYLTLESDALNDPTCFDPNNGGMPCAGKVIAFVTGTHRVNRSLATAEVDSQSLSFSRCGGAGLGKQSLLDEGIPAAVVDKMFKGPITIRGHIKGSVRHVDAGSLFYQLRVFVDG